MVSRPDETVFSEQVQKSCRQMEKTNNIQSWGDMIRLIDSERKTLPWRADEVARPHTVSLAERKLRERDVDLIAMVYRDPIREKLHTSMQSDVDSNLISRRSIMTNKTFNIINHQGSRRSDSDSNLSGMNDRKKKEIIRDWHILSHLKTNDHRNVPIRYEEDNRLEQQKKIFLPTKKGIDSRRDFSIVSGKFKENNDLKEEKIAFDIKNKNDEKFWKTHTYDIIKVKSYDPKNQEIFDNLNISLEKTQGLAQEGKFPSSVSHSEGKTYNILNHKILNKERLEKGSMFKEIRALNRIKRISMDNNIHIKGDMKAMNLEEKSIQKYKYKRYLDEHKRDYNMFNNNLLSEKDTSHFDYISSLLPTTPWDKLQYYNNVNSDNNSSNNNSKSNNNDNNHNNNNNHNKNNDNNSNYNNNNNEDNDDDNTSNKIISSKLNNSHYSKNVTIVANNYMGNHSGTGMNVHRAYTSYPSFREYKRNSLDLLNDQNTYRGQQINRVSAVNTNDVKIENNDKSIRNDNNNNNYNNDNNNNNNHNNNNNNYNNHNNDNNNNNNDNNSHRSDENKFNNRILKGSGEKFNYQKTPDTTRPGVIPALQMSKLPPAVPYVHQISVRTGGLSGL